MNKNIAIILIILVSCVIGHVSVDTSLAIKSTYSLRVYFSNDTVFIYDTTISVKYVKELEDK